MSSAVTVRAQKGNYGEPAKEKGPPRRKESRQDKPEAEILFQQYFKAAGPQASRTYAAQVKRTRGGDHYLVLTEGKRDPNTEELRKSYMFVFSEDFPAFFRLLHETAQFIKANPVPEEVKQKRERYWAKQRGEKSGQQ